MTLTEMRGERRDRGLTLTRAAEQLQVSPSFLSMIETGQRTPGPEVGKRIADFYGVRVSDLWPEPQARTVATGEAAA